MKLATFVFAWYLAWSLATFVAYWRDKRAAAAGTWRTSENTLHLMSLAGGFPGALAAIRVVRHKRQKPVFITVVWAIGLLHIALWVVVLIKAL